MALEPPAITLRHNEKLRYWRHHDLGNATLMQAHYGPFRWEKHVHDEQVIVITEGGTGEVKTRAGSEIGGPGTIWVFAPGEYHFGHVDEGDEWRYRALYLDPASLDAIARHLGIATSKALLRPGLHVDPSLAVRLLHAHQLHGVELAVEQSAWSEALAHLFERYGDPPFKGDASTSRAELRAAREYIAQHFRDDLSIDELARQTNLSRYHFIRAFRSAYGMPPYAYLNQMRVQHARKLLLAGRTACEAALDSGLYDQSRLTSLFKRSYGVTPARYARLQQL